MKFRLGILTTISLIVIFSLPLLAHHSLAKTFDASKAVTITGVVTEIAWMNPHASIAMNVKSSDGKITAWHAELAAPSILFRAGFRKDTVALMSSVTLEIWPARDGSSTAYGRILTLSDGRKFDVHDSLWESPIVK